MAPLKPFIIGKFLRILGLALSSGVLITGHAAAGQPPDPPAIPGAQQPTAIAQSAPMGEPVVIAQLIAGTSVGRNYAGALPSLLREISAVSYRLFAEDPVVIQSFADPALARIPMVYANYADRPEWKLEAAEKAALQSFLDRGGFFFLDAGINAEFLRGRALYGQTHSYADWQVTPEVEALFKELYPDASFTALPRDHVLFRLRYAGLPDDSALPEAIREYVQREKWPGGTYSLMALHLNGRIAVLASPIIAMGWGRDELGRWTNPIGFRVRESSGELTSLLPEAQAAGRSFTAVREDGLQDTIYCQPEPLPAWVQEPGGRWRIFRYYNSTEISDFAHHFYTRLGVNIFLYALCQ